MEKIFVNKRAVLWLTGFSGAGKTTIATQVLKELTDKGIKVALIDADNIKYQVKNIGIYTEEDRLVNQQLIMKRIKNLYNKNYIVLTAFISPLRKSRDFFKSNFPENFFEIYIKTPLKTCINRDPKGLYKKAITGKLPKFVGIDVEYEVPENPSLVIETEKSSIENSSSRIIDFLFEKKIIIGL